jgi:hypothetical protein
MTLTEIKTSGISSTNFKKLITLLESDLNMIKDVEHKEKNYIMLLTDVLCNTISCGLSQGFLFDCTLKVQSSVNRHMKKYKKLRTELLTILDN